MNILPQTGADNNLTREGQGASEALKSTTRPASLHAVGAPTVGGFRLMKTIKKGFQHLPPEESDVGEVRQE